MKPAITKPLKRIQSKASTSRQSTSKHQSAVSGLVLSKKRKSTVLESNNKRDRQISPLKPKMADPVLPTVSKEDEMRFTVLLARALRNEEVIGSLEEMYGKTIDAKLAPVKAKVEKIEAENITRDSRLDNLERRVDEYEQRDRDNNIIISGLTDGDTSPENIKKMLNDSIGTKLDIFAIKYTAKIKSNEGQGKIRVAFNEKKDKDQVMKQKKSLKGRQGIWINDDLTPFRSKLAYHARAAVKAGKISQTWCFDSKIFIKGEEGARPKKVNQIADIPGHDVDAVGEEEFRLRNS